MPVLLPGLLELTRRARYFSIHAFLLDEYRRRRYAADARSLSSFILRREWELGLAVQRCPSKCGSRPVGSRRLGGLAQGPGPFPRGESVESSLGGYGLYYRSPLIEFGIVARSGTLLGGEPIPIDVLAGTERATNLADCFRDAIKDTEYLKTWITTDAPIPAGVIDELAAVGCLCGLTGRAVERDAVHAALFSEDHRDPAAEGPGAQGVRQRRRSVAHYLTLIRDSPAVTDQESVYRDALWDAPTTATGEGHARVSEQWAALIAKDVWQEALCSIWSQFCTTGSSRTRLSGAGLTWEEVRAMSSTLVGGPPTIAGTTRTRDLAAQVSSGGLALADGTSTFNPASATLEALRAWTRQTDTATSGLIVILELARRIRGRDGAGWRHAAGVSSAWQPSVTAVMGGLEAHLGDDPTVGQTLWWLVSNFVLPVHERIAYSKLPELTFRFRWEDGLLRFYDYGTARFPLAAIRNEPLALLTRDLGMWDHTPNNGPAALTTRGEAFITQVLG